MNQIFDASCSIHSKRIRHNDVSRKNILIREVKDSGIFEAFLIDFGLSTEKSDENDGYMGTPWFSPQSVFENYPSKRWNSNKEDVMLVVNT